MPAKKSFSYIVQICGYEEGLRGASADTCEEEVGIGEEPRTQDMSFCEYVRVGVAFV